MSRSLLWTRRTSGFAVKSPQNLAQKILKELSKRIMGRENKHIYEFGKFRLDAETDTLWEKENLISLSPKAFELLKLLVINQGNVVAKDEIFETVWKDTFVEEGVLSQNIYTLRNALGKDENGNHLIENIKRRGYRIAVPVRLSARENKDSSAGLLQNSQNEQSALSENLPVTGSKRFDPGKKKIFYAIGFGIILLAAFGIVLFNLPEPRKTEQIVDSTAKNLDFQRLTDKGDVNFLNISPDGNWVAYSNGDGIFLKDLKSGSEVALKIENFENFGFLQFSKDGNSLYFRSPEASKMPGNVYQTSRFGGAAKLVAENVWGGFSFSPDGQHLAFTRVKPAENKHILIIKNLETGIEAEIFAEIPPFEFYPRNFPVWSADGKRIASVVITRTEHFARLIVSDIETGNNEEIKTENFQNVEQIVWNEDGKSLIASASDGKNFQLWKINYPDGKTERITFDLNDYLGISISADGKKLLVRQRSYFSNIWVGDGKNIESFRQLTQGFARNEGLKGLAWIGNDKIVYTANYDKIRDWNLWIINPADNSRQQLTGDIDTQNEYPVISPDGNSIFFSSTGGNLSNIRRLGIAGENLSQITFDENESELFPQISPDGNWLYFIKEGENSSAVRQKSLIGERIEKITAEGELSPADFLALSPDGKFLAFHNLTKETGGEKSKGFFKVCVISTENPNNKRFYELPSSQPFAYFSNDGKALEFIKITTEGAEILRKQLNDNSEIKSVLSFKNEWIFNLAWSKDGEKLAVSRGKLIRDAVILTGFE